jgi:hypothetical protein
LFGFADYNQAIARDLGSIKGSNQSGKDYIKVWKVAEIYATDYSDLIKRLKKVVVEFQAQSSNGFIGTSDYTRTEKPAWID